MEQRNDIKHVFDTDTTRTTNKRDLAQEAKRDAQDVAKQAKGLAKNQAEAKLEQGKHRAANRIDGVADAIDRFASELNQNDEAWLGSQVATAGRAVRHVSSRIHRQELQDLGDDTRQFSRSHPAIFLGGAFAVGLFAGRFLTSSQRREGTHQSEERRATYGSAR